MHLLAVGGVWRETSVGLAQARPNNTLLNVIVGMGLSIHKVVANCPLSRTDLFWDTVCPTLQEILGRLVHLPPTFLYFKRACHKFTCNVGRHRVTFGIVTERKLALV